MNNLFSNDLMKGVMGMMGNSSGWNSGSEKENLLRNNLQRCTYPDETKYMIEKAVKQLLHVYPFLTPDILMFTENGQPRRYIEVKGILEVEIKGKTCKVDFNMMLPNDYPRTPPFVRIVNRNPDYVVDAFYQSLKSKTDPTSYVLNDKLVSVKAWAPSSSLVNVVIECYDLFKSKFPFSKPVENSYGAGNAWDALYNSKKNNNYGGNGSFNPPANNNWGSPSSWNNNNTNANNWGASNQANNGWQNTNTAWNANNPNPNTWGNNNPNSNNWNNPNTVNNNIWGPNPNNNNNTWGQPVGGMGGMGGISGMGGMGGIVGTNVNGTIASAQKLVGKQKQSLSQMGAQYAKVIEKVQQLDVTKRSLQSQEEYLRKQNYEMANFLKDNESSQISSITSIVQPKDSRSQQILQLLSGIKARQECAILLENKFSQQQLSLEQFLKHVRKIQQSKFQEKCLLMKCIKQN